MISHKHKTIFVHIPKCGGTSVETLFLDDLGITFQERACLVMFPNSNPKIGPKRLSHLSCNEMLDNHFISQELFNKYFKFSVVRDPYDRAYSCYKHMRYSHLMTFNNFLLKILQPSLENKNNLHWFMRPQYEFLFCKKENKLMVDKIFKLENLNKDIKNNYDRFHLSKKNLKIKNLNNSSLEHLNIFDLITEKMKAVYMHYKISYCWGGNKVSEDKNREIIKRLYMDDYLKFNYNF